MNKLECLKQARSLLLQAIENIEEAYALYDTHKETLLVLGATVHGATINLREPLAIINRQIGELTP